MKIAVVLRQVPDLIEPLEIAPSGNELDYMSSSFLINEYDDHALEQSILLKESCGAEVMALALDFGDVDNTLYNAAAKGVDRIIKIPYDKETPPSPRTAAVMYAEAIRPLQPDLVLIGSQSPDELEGSVAPLLAMALQLPYLGVINGAEAVPENNSVRVFKEYPGAAKAKMRVHFPAVLGILTATKPPRYVPISRVRAAMKSTRFESAPVHVTLGEPLLSIRRFHPPETGRRAEIIAGDDETIAARLIQILEEKGLVK